MDYMNMKKTDFQKLPSYQEVQDTVKTFDSIIIIPTMRKHYSGFRIMNFALCQGSKPVCIIKGCADVIHIDGIGGYGWSLRKNANAFLSGWRVDCIPCGYLRLFAQNYLTLENWFGSDFRIYCEN